MSDPLFDELYERVAEAMSKYDGSHDMTHIKVNAIVVSYPRSADKIYSA